MLPDDDSVAGLTDPLLQPHHDSVGGRIEVQVRLVAHLIWQAAGWHCFVVGPNRSCGGCEIANEVLGSGNRAQGWSKRPLTRLMSGRDNDKQTRCVTKRRWIGSG